MRVRASDISDAIFSPKDGAKTELPKHTTGVVVYSIYGKHDDKTADGFPLLFDVAISNKDTIRAEDRTEACAKRVTTEFSDRYFVKSGPNALLYNPIDGLDEHMSHRKRGAESMWQYREVNKKTFESYLLFLKTKNIAWLHQANREVL